MTLTGGCYCEALRYELHGDIPMRALCMCKTCQKISGGGGNFFVGLMAAAFRYTRGEPARFSLTPETPTREFCRTCGVQIAARSPKAPGGIIVKVGTLDDPSLVEAPQMVCWASEKQRYHTLPVGVPVYDSLPGR